jgi:hypothetical protein
MNQKLFTLIIFFLVITTVQATGQSFSLDEYPADQSTIYFEFAHTFLDSTPSLSLLSGTYNLSLQIPLTQSINIVGSLPFVTMGGSDVESSSSIGNVYIGIQTRIKGDKQKGSSISAGVSLPTTSSSESAPWIIGYYTDAINSYRFFPDYTTVRVSVGFHNRKPQKKFNSIHLGAFMVIPKDTDERDFEIFAQYGFSWGIWLGRAILSAEFHGNAIITKDISNFSDRFTHNLTLAATYDRSAITPSLFIRLHLDKVINRSIDLVAGIKLTIPLS